MMVNKQLIIIVEGTSIVGRHWPTILSDYLDNIIREFCGGRSMEQLNNSVEIRGNFELQLVMFLTHGSYGPMRSGWTRNMDVFMDYLNSIQFVGGGLDAAATTHGLADALMMFSIPPNGYKTDENLECKRHCILVAATNPFPFPVPVYRPNFDGSEDLSPCHDAETVAGWFGQCSVSLSVICPRKLSKLRVLYEAGKRNPKSDNPFVRNQHPEFVVLISEDFKEAQAALSSAVLAANQNTYSLSQPDSGTSANYQPDAAPSPMILGCQTFSPSLMSQDPIMKNENTKHVVDGISPSLLAILNNIPDVLHARETAPSAFTDLDLQSMNRNLLIEKSSKMIATRTLLSVPISQTALSSEKVCSVVVSGSGAMAGTSQSNLGEPSAGLHSSAVSMPISQKYLKVWEGKLCRLKQGKAVFITMLEAYRKASASATVAADWPDSIQVVRLILQDRVNHEYKVGRAVLLVFRVVNQHAFISQLHEKKLCAVVELHDQILLLSVSDKLTRLIGMLFPKDAQISSASAAAAAEREQN